MEQFIILSRTSGCRRKEGGIGKALQQDITAYYHADYLGGEGRHRIQGTIENLVCTFKNDITPYSDAILMNAVQRFVFILKEDMPEILRRSGRQSLRVCVIPRAKQESSYRKNQLLLKATIQAVAQRLPGFEDGTHDIIRHTSTATTHLLPLHSIIEIVLNARC